MRVTCFVHSLAVKHIRHHKTDFRAVQSRNFTFDVFGFHGKLNAPSKFAPFHSPLQAIGASRKLIDRFSTCSNATLQVEAYGGVDQGAILFNLLYYLTHGFDCVDDILEPRGGVLHGVVKAFHLLYRFRKLDTKWHHANNKTDNFGHGV